MLLNVNSNILGNCINMRISLFIILSAICLLAQEQKSTSVPKTDRSKRESKDTWHKNETIDLPLAMAKRQTIAKMENKGFTLKHDIPVNDKKDKFLMLWEKGNKQVIIMIWRIDIDKTGMSWGETKK